MKKQLLLVVSLILVLAVALTGCNNSGSTAGEETTSGSSSEVTTQEMTTSEQAAAVQGDASIGLGISSSIAKSHEPGDEEGLSQTDSTAIAVLVDSEGKIVKAEMDSVQLFVNFNDEGKITTPLDTVFKTKNQLKEEYGMKEVSSIEKEWYEQAEYFTEYLKGKTLEDVKNIAIAEDGTAADEDLKAGVTVHISKFIEITEKAMNNLKPGANADDSLGLGIRPNISRSYDAGEKEGLIEGYNYYSAATFNNDGVITAVISDAIQSEVFFTTEGKITSDYSEPVLTKNEMGNDYGLHEASGIGKEWDQQADYFSNYVVGKTVDEMNGIALLEGGEPADEDLKAEVTIHVTEMQETITKAFESRQ